jgi:hypothetical protein
MDRFKTWLTGWVGYFAIAVIGRTIRWRIRAPHLEDIYKSGNRAIFTFCTAEFFHQLIIGGTADCRHDQR